MAEMIKKLDTDVSSLNEITRFLQESFPKNKKFTPDFVKWQYSQNPLGAMEGFNAWDEGKIVSHFAGLPIEMSFYGETKKGLLCINVSTKTEYQGKKLFTQLGQKTIDLATEKGYDFMIAVPNSNSTHAFLKYFGFYLISPLSVKLGVGKNIFSEVQAECFKTWSNDQWEWRLSNPANTYRYDKKGFMLSPITFFAESISQAPPFDNSIAKFSSKRGYTPLKLYIGLGAKTSKGIYLNFPAFIKRPPFNLVFKDLTGKIPNIKKEDIFLQLIDLDTI